MILDLNENKSLRKRGVGNAAYARIADSLRAGIIEGSLTPGAILPSLRQLAAEYNVSIATIQQAVGLLVHDGVLTSKANRGVYVADPANRFSPPQERYTNGAQVGAPVRQLHIGIISPLWEEGLPPNKSAFDVDTVRSLEFALSEAGASTAYSNLGAQRPITPEQVAACAQRLVEDRVDAISVLFVDDIESMQAAVVTAEAAGIPIVLVSSTLQRIPVSRVYYDNREAGAQAAQHLIKQGCREILFFSPFSTNWVTERLNGVQDALRLAGLGLDSLTVGVAELDVEATRVEGRIPHVVAAHEHAARLFAEGCSLDGIVADNDDAAIGFMQAAAEQGYEAGRDYLIIGFDDIASARTHGLTSLRPPIEGLGQTAAKLLIEAAKGGDPKRTVGLRSHLVMRNSTRRRIAEA